MINRSEDPIQAAPPISPEISRTKNQLKLNTMPVSIGSSTSTLLANNCDEFIYYEDLVRQPKPKPKVVTQLPDKKKDCFQLLIDSIEALQREDKEILWGSMVKQTMKRKLPSFNETYYGYRSFSHLLEDAAKNKLIEITRDPKSRSYIITSLSETA